jgi:hypothetical protein
MRRFAILVLVAACACGHKTQDPGAGASGGSAENRPAPPPAAAAPVDATAPVDAGDPESFATSTPTITLDKPGTEPRRVIAYAPHGGDRVATLSFSSGPENAPPGLGLAVAVKLGWKVPADASNPYEFHVIESKALPPKDAKGGEEQVIAAIGAMYSGNAGRVDADAQGRAHLVRTTATVPTNPSLLWLMQPLLVPFPAEAIGVGAKWTVKQPLTMNGADGALERTYELTSTAGGVLGIKVTGSTRWTAQGGSAGDAIVENVTGTLAVKPTDLLAQSAEVTSVQDVGPTKAAVKIKLGP